MPYTANSVTVAGTLTADPTLRHSNGGVPLTQFVLEHRRRWQKRGSSEWSEEQALWECVAWREQAELLVASTRSGWRLIVTGRLEQQQWQRDGEPRSKVVIVADEIGVALSEIAPPGAR